MGKLSHFDIDKIVRTFACKVFIETGTGHGDSLEFASQFAFDRFYSIEIHPEVAERARQRLARLPRTRIVTGTSETALSEILPTVSPAVSVLFWLDAHFPGADSKLSGYKDEGDDDLRLPLERELTLIRSLRPASHDVILIDDLRIYEDGPFACGNMPDFAQTLPLEKRNVDFAYRIFGETHQITRNYGDEGYLILLPTARIPTSPVAG